MILGGALLGAVLALGLLQWESTSRANLASLASATMPNAAEQAAVPPAPNVAPPEPSSSAPAPAPQASAAAADASAPPSTAKATGGNATAGAKVFAAKCNACHPNGNAGLGPALSGPAFTAKYPGDVPLREIIAKGKGSMPPYPPASLSEADMQDLIAYLRSLK